MRHRVEVLHACLRVIREPLHLNVGHREEANLVPNVQHDIDLKQTENIVKILSTEFTRYRHQILKK